MAVDKTYAGVGAAQTATGTSDDFNRADGAPGANWTNVSGTHSIASNRLAAAVNISDQIAIYTGASALGNQTIETDIYMSGANAYPGMVVRYVDQYNFYMALVRPGAGPGTLYKCTGTSSRNYASLGAITDGGASPHYRVLVTGTTSTRIRVYQGTGAGVLICDITDSTSPHTSGQAGYRSDRTDATSYASYDNFTFNPVTVTVTNLDTGWYAQITDGTTTVSGVETTGSVTVDCATLSANATWTLTLWDGNPATTGTQRDVGRTVSQGYTYAASWLEYKQAGSAGAYYPAVYVDDVATWDNNTGDCAITVTDGVTPATYSNITYTAVSLVGAVETYTKTLAAGLDLTCTVTGKGSGVYKTTYSILSTTDKRVKLVKQFTGTVSGTSLIDTYNGSTSANSDVKDFQVAAVHASAGQCAALIPGNGYANYWMRYGTIFVTPIDTSTSNTDITKKTGTVATLTYGLLQNGSTSDYSVHAAANVTLDLSFTVGLGVTSTNNQLRQMVYDAYHDAFNSGTAQTGFNKTIWACAHQAMRTKRHSHTDTRYLWPVPSNYYAPDYYSLDSWWEVIGLGDNTLVQALVDMNLAVGPKDSTYDYGDFSYRVLADSAMDGTDPLVVPYGLAYAKKILNYTPTQTVIDALVAMANRYLTLPGEMLPPAHGTFDKWGDPGQASTRSYWTAQVTGTGTATRVGTDGGVTPRTGSYQGKLVAVADTDVGRLRPLLIAVPASTQLTVTCYVNIPSPFAAGGGVRFNVDEWSTETTGTGGGTTTNHAGTYTTTTTGWQQISYTFTTGASCNYLELGIEASGKAGTVYIDDMACKITGSTTYNYLVWDIPWVPDIGRGDVIVAEDSHVCRKILNLRCIKDLVGGSFTTGHQTLLDGLMAAWPALFWWDVNHKWLRLCLFHSVRKNWVQNLEPFHSAWMVYFLYSEKLFSDADMALLYANYPASALGNNAFRGHVAKTDGTYIEDAELWNVPGQGVYQNGGAWLLLDGILHKLANWQGISGADANLTARLALEHAVTYSAQEVLAALGSGAGDGGAARYSYGWNAALLATPNVSRDITATGGATSGGSATLSRTRAFPAAGGATAAGAATLSRTAILSTSGGATSGGTAAVSRLWDRIASGGATVAGAAALLRERLFSGTGRADSGGAALTERIPAGASPYTFSATGGATSGGAATLQRILAYLASGSATVAGAASVTGPGVVAAAATFVAQTRSLTTAARTRALSFAAQARSLIFPSRSR